MRPKFLPAGLDQQGRYETRPPYNDAWASGSTPTSVHTYGGHSPGEVLNLYPEAAHAASEIDEDDLPPIAEGLFLWPIVVIAAVAAIGSVVVIWSELMAML